MAEPELIEDDDIPEENQNGVEETALASVEPEADAQQHTKDFYNFFQEAFDHYNKLLFDNKLPNVMITVVRKRNIGGYFSPARWANDENKRVHEIAMNPMLFAKSSFLQVMSTFVHEMTHLWREVSFDKSPRGGYHDKKWVVKMQEFGLPPVSRDSKNGTGQRVSHRILKDGLFVQASIQFNHTRVHYADRLETIKSNVDIIEEIEKLDDETSIAEQEEKAEGSAIEPQDQIAPENIPDETGDKARNNDSTPSSNIEDENNKIGSEPPQDYEKSNSVKKLVESDNSKLAEMTKSNDNAITDIEQPKMVETKKPKRKSKYKYQCSCGVNIWGKMDLEVLCQKCGEPFVNQEL